MGIVRASHYSCNNAPQRHRHPPLAHGVAHRLSGGRRADPLPPRLPPHRRPQPAGPRRQAPRNVASILDSARELGIRDAQDLVTRSAGQARDSSSKLQLGCAITTKRSRQIPNVWTSQAQPAGRASLTSVDPTARLGARGSHAHLERRPAAPGTSCRATPRPLSRRPRRSGKVPGHQDRYTPQRRNQNTGSHETDEKPPTRDACLQAPVRRSRPNRE